MFDTSWIGPVVQSLDAARSNVWRVQEARHAERFALSTANTAYQRQVADMRAAGLNPILAAGGGGGADAPQGVPANIQDSDIGGSISSAIQLKKLSQELKNLELIGHDLQASVNNKTADTAKKVSERGLTDAQKTVTEASIAGAKNVEAFEKALGEDTTFLKRFLEIMRMILK